MCHSFYRWAKTVFLNCYRHSEWFLHNFVCAGLLRIVNILIAIHVSCMISERHLKIVSSVHVYQFKVKKMVRPQLLKVWMVVLYSSLKGEVTILTPVRKVHGANMGPTWVLSAQIGPILAPWTLLSGPWDSDAGSGKWRVMQCQLDAGGWFFVVFFKI